VELRSVLKKNLKKVKWWAQVENSVFLCKMTKRNGNAANGIVVNYRLGYRIRYKLKPAVNEKILLDGNYGALAISARNIVDPLGRKMRRKRADEHMDIPKSNEEIEDYLYDTLYDGYDELKALNIDLGPRNLYSLVPIASQRILLASQPDGSMKYHTSTQECLYTECNLADGNTCTFTMDFNGFFEGISTGCECADGFEGQYCTIPNQQTYAVGIILGAVFGTVLLCIILSVWGWPLLLTVLGRRKKIRIH